MQRTRGLAGSGTDPTGKFGEVIGRMQRLNRAVPVAPINQIIPIRNNVIHWTTVLAKRNAAIHASRTLSGSGGIIEPMNEFLIVMQPQFDRITGLA